MTKEEIMAKADEVIIEVISNFNDIIARFEAEGMSEDDIGEVCAEVIWRGMKDERYQNFMMELLA